MDSKTISDYLNMPFHEVFKLNVVERKYFLREAFIFKLSQTDEGIKYLKNAKRLEITNPEREKLKNKKGANLN